MVAPNGSARVHALVGSDLDANCRQGRWSRAGNHGRAARRIELRAMAWTHEQAAGRVKCDGAAGVRARSVESSDAPSHQRYRDRGVAAPRVLEGEKAMCCRCLLQVFSCRFFY